MMNDRYPKIKLREYPEYVPHSTVGLTLSAAAYSFGAGVLASAVKNTLLKPKNAGYLHPKTGFYVYLFTATGAAYTFAESVSANIREKEDGWNKFNGGAAAGAIIGATFKSVPKVVGFAALIGSALGIYEWSGGAAGWGREQALSIKGDITELTEEGQKQGFWDVVQRRPLSQTLDELGDLVRPFK